LAHLINKEIAYMNKPKMQQIENKFYSLGMIKPKCLAPDLILVKTRDDMECAFRKPLHFLHSEFLKLPT
jgi:hypothetical protein